MHPVVGDTILDKYKLIRLLGEGGMAQVYEAQHLVLGRRVALKMLHPHLTRAETIKLRLLREAKAASAVRHPNIIQVEDIGTLADGSLFIVMEFLEGSDLGTILEAEGRLPVARAVTLTEQILAGLHAAHEKGIFHRDLKPDNVFVTEDSRLGEVAKILDFGISKFDSGAEDERVLTQHGMLLGTPHYMAPEQAEGAEHADLRADLWALGILLYRMLSGQLPFVGGNYNQILTAIVVGNEPPLTEIAPDTPPGLVAIVKRAMEREPEDRYPTAAAMLDELQAFAAEQGIDARPAARSSGRRTAVASVATAVAVAAPADAGTPTVPLRGGSGSADSPEREAEPPGAAAPEVEPPATEAREPSPSEAQEPIPSADAEPTPDEEAPESDPGEAVRPDRRRLDADAPESSHEIALAEPVALRRGWVRAAVWAALAMGLGWLLWQAALHVPRFARLSFGIDASWGSRWSVILLAAALVASLPLAWALEWVLRRLRWLDRWGGMLVLALPLLLLGFLAYRHQIFAGALKSVEGPIGRFETITAMQAQFMAAGAAGSLARLLTVGALAVGVGWLVLGLGLVDRVIAPRRPATSRRLGEAALTLTGGVLVIGLAELIAFPYVNRSDPALAGRLGFTLTARLSLYATWLLGALAVLRASGSSARGIFSERLHAFVLAGLALFLLTGAAIAMLYASAFTGVRLYDTTRTLAEDNRHLFAALITRGHRHALVLGLLDVALLGALIWPVWRAGRQPKGWKSGLAAGIVVGTAALTGLVFTLAARRERGRIYLPFRVTQMQPLRVAKQDRPQAYIDQSPEALRAGRAGLWAKLAGKPRASYREGALLARLRQGRPCARQLERALAAKRPQPARCITAIEAHLYCQALGKRLPTPKEWRAALGRTPRPDGKGKNPPDESGMQRGPFAEWTRKVVSGNPSYSIEGAEARRGEPKRLEADRFSPAIGFRCVAAF